MPALNAYPGTRETTAEPVTVLHKNVDNDLIEVTVEIDGQETVALRTTSHHPFWNPGLNRWTDAGHLTPGTALLTSTGQHVRVINVANWLGAKEMLDLTVANEHTYYVLAGETPVLVHNCGGDTPARSMADKPLGPDANPLQGTRYTEKVQEQIKSGDDHGFPAQIDTLPTMRDTSTVNGRDGIPRLHVKLPGSVNGSSGTFHWIIESDGSINHRLFDRRMR